MKNREGKMFKAICLVGNPLVPLEEIERSGQLSHEKKRVELALQHYNQVYYVSPGRRHYELSSSPDFHHVLIRQPPLPRLMNLAYTYMAGTMTVFRAGRKCDLIRADGMAIELNAVLGSLLCRKPMIMSYRADSAFVIRTYAKGVRGRVVAYFFDRVTNFCLKHSTMLIASTETLKRKAMALGINPEKIIVIPTPIDTGVFRPSWDGAAVRKKHALEDKRVLLFVGRIRPEKRVDNLLRALKKVNEKCGGKVHLIIAGAPYKEEEERLRKLTRDLGLSPCVIRTGAIKHQELPAYYAAADVFVLPSLIEGLPNALMEAMAMGRPVVGTRTDGITDLVTDGENGLLVKVDDIQSLADAITTVLSDDALAAALGWNARRTIEQRFSREVILEKHSLDIASYTVMINE